MESPLTMMFAAALTLSQVTTEPDNIRTSFDRIADQPQVGRLLQAGCAHMRKAFDIEDVNLDDLIATAMEDPIGLTAGSGGAPAAFRGISFADLFTAYKQFCKGEKVEKSPVNLGEVIDVYNRTVADLPDHNKLKSLKLPGSTIVLDRKGDRFAELFEQNQRRVIVKLADIPMHVVRAFVSAEDKRFFEHHGIDEHGIIRAFGNNFARTGRPQGASTITQQVVKNLAVGDSVSYERKMREMIVAARLERALSKNEILELYLNSVYLGRGSYGIEMASRSYFGKPANALSLAEGAMLAALTKGPTVFNPDRNPTRAQERMNYVLGRMQEDGVISAESAKAAVTIGLPKLIALERPRNDIGFHFVDHISREAKQVAGVDALSGDQFVVRSTINPELQRATEVALQEGLANFEAQNGRARFQAPEANLGEAIAKLEAEAKTAAPSPATAARPAWRRALETARLPGYDVHWPTAVIVERTSGRSGDSLKIGLADGRVLPLNVSRAMFQRLKLYDVVFVRVTEGARGSKAAAARAELRIRPEVQGSALVIENKTGRILAMAGSFSYGLSQFNRTTQGEGRQPGSTLKPLTYLAALQRGIQPNTLVRDETITLPPLAPGRVRDTDYWTPRNSDRSASGVITLRRALEQSRNLATVNLLDGGIDITPALSLDRVCALAIEAQIYKECVHYYPFVLGAQPVRPIDIAGFYAAIANEGMRPIPHAIETIEQNGKVVYSAPTTGSILGSADKASFFQLKNMMQGVLQRGTAATLAHLAPYVAGKTGTTDDANDAWFVGFSNDVTVAVWVGYDNAAGGRRRTLGDNQTAARVAAPIFDPIMQATFTYVAPRTALAPPSPEARRELVAVRDGFEDDFARGSRGGSGQVEYVRRDRDGRARDSRYLLVSRDGAVGGDDRGRDPFGRDPFGRAPDVRPTWGFPSWGGNQGGRDRDLFGVPRTADPRTRGRNPWDFNPDRE